MRSIALGGSDLSVPSLILGLMRIQDLSDAEIRALVSAAQEEGITMVDHADIYGVDHACEERFGSAMGLSASQREELIIQTKCGIRFGWFDFSAEHIMRTVEASLRALRTEYIDVLLLHRPDALMEPEEVAGAFDRLEAQGKVRRFGVSNHTRGQLELLRSAVRQPLLANQLQLSPTHAPMIAEGLALNMAHDQSIMRTDGILDYCRLTHTTIQAWSPFQSGDGSGPYLGNREAYGELNDVVDRLAAEHGVAPEGIATAWILRHPARMQVVLGTRRPERVRACAAGADIELSREHWYEIFRAAGYIVP
ncbi:aldo/keto reductase family oxidoreductase [Actinomyces slackii]|uniref:Oxidoreductase YdhF n=1 Tax=Actinomyces slackii TaxID=52774 RepID=A0A3S4TD85_9ACTO|nr:aldo/keto reductase [Actinomyces slackii]VEG75229.1 Oxidoreductase YdhF [Actinomyces slackii]